MKEVNLLMTCTALYMNRITSNNFININQMQDFNFIARQENTDNKGHSMLPENISQQAYTEILTFPINKGNFSRFFFYKI